MTNRYDNFDDDQSHDDYNDSDYFVTDNDSQTEVFESVSPQDRNEEKYYGEDETELIDTNDYDEYHDYNKTQVIFDLNDFHYDNLSPQDLSLIHI